MRRPSVRGAHVVPCLLAAGLAALAVVAALSADRGSATIAQAGFTVFAVLAVALLFAGAQRRATEQRTWRRVGVAVAVNLLCEITAGWARTDPDGPWSAISVTAGGLLVPIVLVALIALLRARIGRLRAVAALDGLTAALVVQTLIAL